MSIDTVLLAPVGREREPLGSTQHVMNVWEQRLQEAGLEVAHLTLGRGASAQVVNRTIQEAVQAVDGIVVPFSIDDDHITRQRLNVDTLALLMEADAREVPVFTEIELQKQFCASLGDQALRGSETMVRRFGSIFAGLDQTVIGNDISAINQGVNI